MVTQIRLQLAAVLMLHALVPAALAAPGEPAAACCWPSSECTQDTESACTGAGGTFLGTDVSCDDAVCPLLCEGADAPECGGECPLGSRCEPTLGGRATTSQFANECHCFEYPGRCCQSGGGCSVTVASLCDGLFTPDATCDTPCPTICADTLAPTCGGACPDNEECVTTTLEPWATTSQVGSECECRDVTGGCCWPSGACTEQTESSCTQTGGSYLGDGSDCASAECPVLCGGATAPECNGECPEGERCEAMSNDFATTSQLVYQCTCEPMIPQGGDCSEEPENCVTGFCVDDVCCNEACDAEGQRCDGPVTPGICADSAMAPIASTSVLWISVAGLLALGLLTLSRRRRAAQRRG